MHVHDPASLPPPFLQAQTFKTSHIFQRNSSLIMGHSLPKREAQKNEILATVLFLLGFRGSCRESCFLLLCHDETLVVQELDINIPEVHIHFLFDTPSSQPFVSRGSPWRRLFLLGLRCFLLRGLCCSAALDFGNGFQLQIRWGQGQTQVITASQFFLLDVVDHGRLLIQELTSLVHIPLPLVISGVVVNVLLAQHLILTPEEIDVEQASSSLL
mmetsp:Transcript_131840/g.186002  ORF Transcript_131840/g.186002 Transcript_131840/m.186002 type:complete len:214 (+) Transcript_131840:23-664(+)